MRFGVSITGIAAAMIISGVASLATGRVYAASGEEVIKARINFMKDEVERQWRVLAAFSSKGKGSLADVEASSRALVKLAAKIPEHFPKDTGRGKYPDNVTRALPAIWEDWEGFKMEAQRLAEETEKLARFAREGNKDAVVDLIGPAGYARTKIGCADCHSTFRGPAAKK